AAPADDINRDSLPNVNVTPIGSIHRNGEGTDAAGLAHNADARRFHLGIAHITASGDAGEEQRGEPAAGRGGIRYGRGLRGWWGHRGPGGRRRHWGDDDVAL